jgi:hypothetical protein
MCRSRRGKQGSPAVTPCGKLICPGRGWSGSVSVFVDESVTGPGPLDPTVWPDRDDIADVVWCSLVDSAVGPVGVVVVDVLE